MAEFHKNNFGAIGNVPFKNEADFLSFIDDKNLPESQEKKKEELDLLLDNFAQETGFLNQGKEKKERTYLSVHGKEKAKEIFSSILNEKGQVDQGKMDNTLGLLDDSNNRGNETAISSIKKSLKMRAILLKKGQLKVEKTTKHPSELIFALSWDACVEKKDVERQYSRLGKKGKEKAKEVFSLFIESGGVDDFGYLNQGKAAQLLASIDGKIATLKQAPSKDDNQQLEALTLLKRSLETRIRIFKKEDFYQELRTSNSKGRSLVDVLIQHEKKEKPNLSEGLIRTYTESRLLALTENLDQKVEALSLQIIGDAEGDLAKQLFFKKYLLQKNFEELKEVFTGDPQKFMDNLSERNYDTLSPVFSKDSSSSLEAVKDRIIIELRWELKEYESEEKNFRITPENINQVAKKFEERFRENTLGELNKTQIFDNFVEMLGDATGMDVSEEVVARMVTNVLTKEPSINIYGHEINFKLFLEKFIDENSEHTTYKKLLSENDIKGFKKLKALEDKLSSSNFVLDENSLLNLFLEIQKEMGCSQSEALEVLFNEHWFQKIESFAPLKALLEENKKQFDYEEAIEKHNKTGLSGWVGGFLEDVLGKRFGFGKKGKKLERRLERKLAKIKTLSTEEVDLVARNLESLDLDEEQRQEMEKLGVLSIREKIFSSFDKDFSKNNAKKMLKIVNTVRLFTMLTPMAMKTGEVVGGVGFWARSIDGVLDATDEIQKEANLFVDKLLKSQSEESITPLKEIVEKVLESEPKDKVYPEIYTEEFLSEAESTAAEDTPIVVEVDFNLELDSLQDFELLNTIDGDFVVRANEGARLLIIPVMKDLFVDSETPIREIALSGGDALEIKEVRIIQNQNGETFQVGVVAGNYGSQSMALIIMDSGSTEFEMDSLDYVEHAPELLVSVSYIAGSENIYPNKVFNDIQALINIATYQEENGPFKPGENYSAIDMLSIADSGIHDYLNGKTSASGIVRAGGVCSVVTGLSSLLYRTFDDFHPTEQWDHPSRYFQGPFSMDEKQVDATVEVMEGKDYDFMWDQPGDTPLYIHYDVSFAANNQGGGGEYDNSDLDLIVTMSFSEKPPEGQLKNLTAIMQQYQDFRNGDTTAIDNNFDTHDWANATDFIDTIYNPEDLRAFAHEEERLTLLLELQDVLNSVPVDEKVSEFVMDSEWYADWIEKYGNSDALDDLNTALRMVDYGDYVEGERVQCVGFAILMAAVFPELNIQNIGGAENGDIAKKLIPTEISSGKSFSSLTGFGGIALGNLDITGIHKGDLFVRTDSPSGHIGAILGEVTVDGEIILLVADANRHLDGKVNIFTVNQDNFFEIFNEQVNIIRSADNHQLVAMANPNS